LPLAIAFLLAERAATAARHATRGSQQTGATTSTTPGFRGAARIG
jgi:hypothetical protein